MLHGGRKHSIHMLRLFHHVSCCRGSKHLQWHIEWSLGFQQHVGLAGALCSSKSGVWHQGFVGMGRQDQRSNEYLATVVPSCIPEWRLQWTKATRRSWNQIDQMLGYQECDRVAVEGSKNIDMPKQQHQQLHSKHDLHVLGHVPKRKWIHIVAATNEQEHVEGLICPSGIAASKVHWHSFQQAVNRNWKRPGSHGGSAIPSGDRRPRSPLQALHITPHEGLSYCRRLSSIENLQICHPRECWRWVLWLKHLASVPLCDTMCHQWRNERQAVSQMSNPTCIQRLPMWRDAISPLIGAEKSDSVAT